MVKMRRRRHKKWLAFFLALVLALTMMPGTVLAEGNEPGNEPETGSPPADGETAVLTDTSVTDEAAFISAVAAGGTVVLEGGISLTQDVTVSQDVVLDLNGYALTTGSYSLKVGGGDLTIRDSSQGAGGKITGMDYIVDMNTSGGDTLTLESGTLEGTGWTAAVRVAAGDTFNMTGGVVRQTQSNVTTVVQLNANGTANVTGGRIEGGIRGIYVVASTSKLTVGQVPAGSVQTEEEAGAVYVSSVYAGSASASVSLNSGTVGRIFGSVGESFVLNCWFEQDVSGYLPASFVAEQENGHWIVRALAEEDAAAKIGDALYGSVVKAAAELKDGETLTLLRDYEGSQDIKIEADNATVDLNGFSITNTAEGGYGINFSSTYTTSAAGGSVAVVNNGTNASKITAATPLRVHSGNSLNVLPLTLGDNIELVSTGETYVELGVSATIGYSETAASYVKSGGFLSTAEDGTQYIYGSFVQAAENDVNKTALLLNDYQGSISLGSSQALTLDLNGHTVTSGSTAVIRVNTSDASLTIKNGTMITENGTGAEVGLPAAGGIDGTVTHHNVTLNLEDVALTANGSADDGYGIITNGTSTGINISLKGGSVNAPNGIGIYFPPADSTLTIDGTTITGTTGVAVKGGDVTIKGGAQISGTGEKREPSPVNSGVTNTGSAVYVEGNYDRDINVNIESGMFTSVNSTAVQMLKDDTTTSDTETIVISGGTFSDKPEDEFVYTGLKAVETDDRNYTINKLTDVYLDGTGGNDSNSGTDSSNAVRTLEHALKLVAEDGVIYICGEVELTSSLTVSDVTIKRAEGYGGRLLRTRSINNGETPVDLTLRNVVIDGNRDVVITTDVGELLTVGRGSTVRLEAGTELKNNYTTAVYVNQASGDQPRGSLIIDGGKITGNGTADGFVSENPDGEDWIYGSSGGGIYNSGYVEMISGEISGNTAEAGGGIHNNARGEILLSGGVIKDNTSLYNGGGIQTVSDSVTLDGASIINNKAKNGYGGGISVESSSGTDAVVFAMKSGTIAGNISAYSNTGSGIFGWSYYGGPIDISISGGTLGDAEGERVIALYGTADAWPKLNLSGSPDITGRIFLWDANTSGYQVNVTGDFSTKRAIPIERQNGTMNIVAVNYADGLTPSLEDFTPYYTVRDTLVVNSEKNTLDWALAVPAVTVEASASSIHVEGNVTLTAKASHSLDNVAFSYQWYKDGIALSGETGETLTVSEAGSYTVKVAAENDTYVSVEAESTPVVITVEGHVYVPVVTEPTCTEQGYTTYTCSCGESYVTNYTEATGHSFSDKWSSDGEDHWHECVNCGMKKDVSAHTFAWVTDQNAGAGEDSRHEECTVCGYVKQTAAASQNAATKTGDSGNGLLCWLFLLAASGAALTGAFAYSRKRKY